MIMNINYEIDGIDASKYFSYGVFPAGEEHIWIKEFELEHIHEKAQRNESVKLVMRNASSMNMMRLGMMVDILRRAGIKNINLVIPYLPYSRQDRYTVDGESFALKVFANFINSLGFNAVYTVDVHSDVSGVIDNLFNLPVSRAISKIVQDIGRDGLQIVFPDAGAAKKIDMYLADVKNVNLSYVVASKKRDLATGNINGISVPDLEEDVPVLVIDDLCDGGRTFTEIEKKMIRFTKNSPVYLYVTHGVFSKTTVFDSFDTVFSTNSYSRRKMADNHKLIELQYTKRNIR